MSSFDKAEQALSDIRDEMQRAIGEHGWFNSRHEGYAVILEELDELWNEIKQNASPEYIYAEAIQVSAMAMEFAAQYGRGVKKKRSENPLKNSATKKA